MADATNTKTALDLLFENTLRDLEARAFVERDVSLRLASFFLRGLRQSGVKPSDLMLAPQNIKAPAEPIEVRQCA